jgi:hypothetical protein
MTGAINESLTPQKSPKVEEVREIPIAARLKGGLY